MLWGRDIYFFPKWKGWACHSTPLLKNFQTFQPSLELKSKFLKWPEWPALYDPALWNVSDFISYFPRNDGLLALPQTLSKCTYSRAFELDILSEIFRYLHHWLPYFSGFCSNVTLSWRPSLATLAKNLSLTHTHTLQSLFSALEELTWKTLSAWYNCVI